MALILLENIVHGFGLSMYHNIAVLSVWISLEADYLCLILQKGDFSDLLSNSHGHMMDGLCLLALL